jgi:hypothetical protein
MAAICRITICAFIFGDIPKGLEHGYTDFDLINGIDYCEGLMEDGFTHDPIDQFSLTDYMAWARRMLGNESPELTGG